MDINIYNKSFLYHGIVDIIISLLWTDRYNSCGNFELIVPLTQDNINLYEDGYYMSIPAYSNRLMIIEGKAQKTSEDGDVLVISGRSLESILDRRIVQTEIILDGSAGSFAAGIEQVLEENVYDATNTLRNITNFVFTTPTDSNILALTLEAKYFTDNVYALIESICKEKNLGFKILKDSSNQFVFTLYFGIDRSYQQTTNPYVVFSKNFGNLLNGLYIEDSTPKKTITFVLGDLNDGTYGPTEIAKTGDENLNDLDRREVFTDASSLSHFIEGSTTPIAWADYEPLLQEKGLDNLKDYKQLKEFEGEAEPGLVYDYNVDYFVGDIVEFRDDYGHASRVRVIEVSISANTEGIVIHPIFEIVT